MKKVQKTLTAALAATLATGIVGSVANAETVNEMYNAAYNATQNALAKKDQVSINEARAAIAKMPAEYKNHMSTFSALLDGVQQPIYVNILTALEKAQKENNQANINAARKMLVGVEQSYANTWSSELDKSQQALIKSAQDACEKATKSGDAKDIKEAQALLADIKTVEANEGVKTFIEKYETEFTTGLTVTALDATVDNSTTITVNFNREIDEDTVSKDDFILKNGNLKGFVKEVEVAEDKKSVTIKVNKLEEKKEYSLIVRNIKDTKGNEIKENTFAINYEKKDVKSIEFTREKAVRGDEAKKMIKVLDAADRNITAEVKPTFTCSEDKSVISKDGRISSAAKLNKTYNITVTVGEVTETREITVVEKLAEEVIGYTIGREASASDADYNKISPNMKIKSNKSGVLTVFFKNADGTTVAVAGKDLKVKSLDNKVITVGSDNVLTAHNSGNALVEVKYGTVEYTIEVSVVKENVSDFNVTLESDTITVAKRGAERTMDVKVEDNATGKEVKGNDYSASVKYYNGKDWVDFDSSDVDVVDGKITVKEGSTLSKDTSAKLVVTYQGVKVEREFEIIVVTAGKTTGYELVADKTELEQNKGEVANLSVYEIDEDGNRKAKIDTDELDIFVDSVEVKDDKNELVFSALDKSRAEYEIVAKIGTKKSNTITITVKNTDDTKTSADGKSVKSGTAIKDAFEWSYGDYNNETEGAQIVGISYDSMTKSDVTTTGAGIDAVVSLENEKTKGMLTIHVNTITVQFRDENNDLVKKVIEVYDDITISVKAN